MLPHEDVIDDKPDLADLFHQRSRREWRQCTYLMHVAASGAHWRPARAIWDENDPINSPGHSGVRALTASPEPRNTGFGGRVHEPVFMASGPGPFWAVPE
jgi:hypothetical protein